MAEVAQCIILRAGESHWNGSASPFILEPSIIALDPNQHGGKSPGLRGRTSESGPGSLTHFFCAITPITFLLGTLVSSSARWALKRTCLLGLCEGPNDVVPHTVLHVENGSSRYEHYRWIKGLFSDLPALNVHTFPVFLAQDSFCQQVWVMWSKIPTRKYLPVGFSLLASSKPIKLLNTWRGKKRGATWIVCGRKKTPFFRVTLSKAVYSIPFFAQQTFSRWVRNSRSSKHVIMSWGDGLRLMRGRAIMEYSGRSDGLWLQTGHRRGRSS